MKVSNMQAVEEFAVTQAEYAKKKEELAGWQRRFEQLEQETVRLIQFFEEQYARSEIGEEFAEDMRTKLENRRDGIRLSVKGANRLLRRLNMDKPIGGTTEAFIFPDMLQQTDAAEEVQKAVQEEAPAAVDPAEELEEEAADDDTVRLQEAIQVNHGVLQDLDEWIEVAEKRFLSFMEKGVAPVLDGLYSGSKYGEELAAELLATGHEQTEQVESWLDIYGVLMNRLDELFRQFSLGLFVPEAREQFDEYKHEPIGVVEDAAFADEQIKEAVRPGLVYYNEPEEPFLVRPAQVIVVKNTTTTIEEQ